MFFGKSKFYGQISLGNSGSRKDNSPSGRVQAVLPRGHRPVSPHSMPRVSETDCRAQSRSMCSRCFRSVILVVTCRSSQRRVDRKWKGRCWSGRGNALVQKESGRLTHLQVQGDV